MVRSKYDSMSKQFTFAIRPNDSRIVLVLAILLVVLLQHNDFQLALAPQAQHIVTVVGRDQ